MKCKRQSKSAAKIKLAFYPSPTTHGEFHCKNTRELYFNFSLKFVIFRKTNFASKVAVNKTHFSRSFLMRQFFFTFACSMRATITCINDVCERTFKPYSWMSVIENSWKNLRNLSKHNHRRCWGKKTLNEAKFSSQWFFGNIIHLISLSKHKKHK